MKQPTLYRRWVQPVLERAVAGAALAACSPLLLLLAIWVALESGWPVLFRQTRVGRGGKTFTLLKFRSMRPGVGGSGLTSSGDPRVTRVGSVLRKYKLDELPQLWNILAGDMQFIGPRPDLPCYVDPDDRLWRMALTERPGLTDLSTLVYRNEEAVLSRYRDPDQAYREEILPRKLSLSVHYLTTRNFWRDCKLLLLTARYSFIPSGFDADRIARIFMEESQ